MRVTQVIAATMGFAAFAIALLSAAAGEVPSVIALSRALIALVVCYLLGQAIGAAGMIAVREHLAALARREPVPDLIDERKIGKPEPIAGQAEQPAPSGETKEQTRQAA